MTSGEVIDDKYQYQMVPLSDEWKGYVIFELMAGKEGHVALADDENVHDANVYEFIIGGWDNTQIAIR